MLLWLSTLALGVVPAEVADAVATGDCAAVDRQLADSEYHDARLVRGWCATREGRHDEAVALLEPLREGVLGDYGRLVRARAQVALGQHAAALDTLDGLKLPGDAGLEVRLVRARALIRLHRSLEARPDLRLLLQGDVADEARFLLAEGARDRGDLEPAIATYRRVWIDSTVGGWSERAAAVLKELGKPVPDYDSGGGRELVKQRVAALKKANQHKAALAHLLELEARSTGASGPITMAKARFRGRDYPGAVAMYRKALGEPAKATGAASHLFDYALGMSRTGDYDTAAVIYRRLVQLHPSDKKANTAHYKLGYLEVDRNDCAKAVPLLREHVKTRPGSRHVDEALWWIGRCHWRQGEWQAATSAWG